MTVPASKRTKAKSEYANQARIVLLATRNLFRKWPKSRNCLETVHVMHIAYEMYSSAYSADIIYASTVEEHTMKLQLLCKAQGMVNYRDDERRGLDVGVTPATLVREVVAGTPSIMGG
jgi:hypothetical protein